MCAKASSARNHLQTSFNPPVTLLLRMPNHPTHNWHRTKTHFSAATVCEHDLSLLVSTADRIDQVFSTGKDELISSWRWRLWLDHQMNDVAPITELSRKKPARGY